MFQNLSDLLDQRFHNEFDRYQLKIMNFEFKTGYIFIAGFITFVLVSVMTIYIYVFMNNEFTNYYDSLYTININLDITHDLNNLIKDYNDIQIYQFISKNTSMKSSYSLGANNAFINNSSNLLKEKIASNVRIYTSENDVNNIIYSDLVLIASVLLFL